MSSNPILSIITVNLNNRDDLQRTIDSVINQTFTDYEWIVIDGGSTDGSKELIEKYSDHFAYWVSEPDKGIYNAMNKGISHAQGEWLQFLNSGDWLCEKSTLEQVFSQKHTGDVLYGDVIDIIQNNKRPYVFPDSISLHFLYQRTLSHQATFYKSSVFFEHKYDESYKIAADWAYSCELVFRGKIFEHIKQYIVYFDVSGISTEMTNIHLLERKRVVDTFFPVHVMIDMEMISNIKAQKYKIEKRKSTRLIYSFCKKLCDFIDKTLTKLGR